MVNLADYEDWKSKRQQASVGVANVVLGAAEDTPDAVAGDLNLSTQFAKTTGSAPPPLPMVKEYRNVFQQRIDEAKNTTILSKAPRLTEWLRNPENASVARDDLEGLSWWETTAGAASNAVSRGLSRVPQSFNQFMASGASERLADQKRSIGDILSDQTAIRGADGTVKGNKPLAGPDDLLWAGTRFVTSRFAQAFGNDQEQAAVYFQKQAGDIAKRIASIPMSPAGERYKQQFGTLKPSGDMGKDLGSFVDTVAADPGGFLAFLTETAVESAPSLAAAVAVTAATRSPTAGGVVLGAYSGAVEAGVSPVEFLREQGVDVSTPEGAKAAIMNPDLMRKANQRGLTRGVIIGVMDGLSGGIAGQQLAASPIGNMALQAVVQAAFGAGGEAGAQIASGQQFNLAEVIIEGLAEFVTAPVEVASMGGSSFMKNRAKAADAEGRKALFAELSGQSQNSALRNRMPDKFRQFVEQATAGGPVENVYVPAQEFMTYFQSIGVDPWALVDDEFDGVTREDLDAALAGGGDLQIPTATYAAKIAGSEHDAFLMENMRFDPDQMTAKEAAAFNEKAQDALDEAWQVAEDLRQEQEKFRTFEAEIYDTMVSRLRVAGRSTDVATSEAMLYPAFYRVMAERAGMAIDEFMARYPLPQVEGALPKGMQLRDVDALTRTLAEARSRKAVKDKRQTLLEFISDYGGINDVGGELRSMDAETVSRGRGKKTLRLARKGLVAGVQDMLGGASSGKRFGPDDVARTVIEAGYLADDPIANAYRAATEQGTEAPDITPALWAAIDRELRGEAQYSAQDDIDPAVAANADLDQIEAYLSSVGVSLDDGDDAIKAAIAEGEGRQYGQGQLEFLFQGPASTTSQAFKDWFGKSKVIDGDGNPMVVHHWTYFDFDTFDRMAILKTNVGKGRDPEGIDRIGNWFTDSDKIRYAAPSMGGRRVDAYLSIQKPLWMDDIPGGKDSFTQLNDFIKTNGGATKTRELLKDQGYDGVIMTATNLDGATQNVFITFEPEQIKSVDNRGTFKAESGNIYEQNMAGSTRGSVQFPAAGIGNGDTVIRLFETADLSTMVHESGHYFLTVMQDMAARGEQNAAADYAAVKHWWRAEAAGVAKDAMRVMPDVTVTEADVTAALDAGTTGDTMKDAAIDVGMQEQWARAFETYLMEGKAPSSELRGAFEKFRAWLLSVYRRLASLNVNPTDDLRAVFDRMLATDEEIAKAQNEAGGTANVFATAEEMGLTQEEFDRFLTLRSQAEDDAKGKLLRETMAPIRREQEKWYRDEKKAVRDEVERGINAAPMYRAIEWMGNRRWLGEGQPADMPDIRLSKDALVALYGEGVLKTLPRGKQTVYAVEGGIDPDTAAGWFGFDSGDEMIRGMETAPKRAEAIAAETERVMMERHGDVLNDGAIEAEALDAVHTDKRGQWIAAELKAITEIAGTGVGMTAKEARATAKQTIARMRVRDAMNANRFLSAERKAAEEGARLGKIVARDAIWMGNARRRVAGKAREALRGDGAAEAVAAQAEAADRSTGRYNEDVAKLVDAKRRQLLNHALYMEARAVTDEVEKAERFVAKLNKATTRERIAGAGRRENAQVDYLGAIDEILERYDFRKLSNAAEQRRGGLAAFIEAMKLAGRENELAIPEDVLMKTARAPYKTLPVEELRGVVDTLKNLEHIATRWDKLIDARQQRELEAVVADITAAFDANVKKRPPGRVGTRLEALRNSGRQFVDLVLTSGTILREIDGFKDVGAAYRNMKAPIDEAMSRLIVRKEKAATDLEALYAVYSKDDRRRMAVREHIPELGYSLSKWERIAAALNLGNEGNRQRLTDPKVRGSLTEEQVAAVVATLDERDAKFIQSVWDYIGSFRDDIAAREKRATGVEPKWVEASPVTIGGVTLRGGYYPIKYDPRLSSLARDDETQEIAQSLQAGRFGKAQTKQGHLKDRAQSSGRDVELDMSVLHRHVNQVVYDLELSEPVANSWRILQNGEIRAAFMEAGKQADFDALETWLKDVAEGEIRGADFVGRAARVLKSNFTAAKLAFNLSTVMMQVTGVAQTMVVVGKRDFARGVQASFRPGVTEDIVARSPYMSTRQTTFNKDIYDFYSDPKTGPVASRWGEIKSEIIGPLSFWLMTKVQWYVVDIPTWLAGYQQGLRKFGNDETQAVAHADAIVKRAQASGLFSDRSAVERGSVNRTARQNDVVRLFTTLGSYMFAKFNVAYERTATAKRTIREEGVSGKSAVEALSWTLDMAFLFTLEAVLMGAIKGQLPDGEDEDETWLKFLAKETGFALMGTVPFVRDGASAFKGFDGGGAYGGAVKDAIGGVMGAAGVIGAPMSDDGLQLSDVKKVIAGTGLATGLPSTQINRAVDAAWRASEGKDVSPLEYLLGKTGKSKN
ncbi:MAG TPA: hypothetical protein VIU82_21850 [Bosea sp. (in: a-proteobacteria)]